MMRLLIGPNVGNPGGAQGDQERQGGFRAIRRRPQASSPSMGMPEGPDSLFPLLERRRVSGRTGSPKATSLASSLRDHA